MKSEPQKEHQWLEKLVGEWEYETETSMEPGQPPAKFAGKETVRSLGGVWILYEGRGEMPGGEVGTTLMTLGYDPVKQKYVGTFIGSMMTHMWVYEGKLDAAEKVLTLDTEGPSFADQTKMARYQDVIEVKGDDHRVLSARFLGDDGQWHHFMTANYRRRK